MTAKEYLQRYKAAYLEAQDIEMRMAKLRLKYAMPSAVQYSDMPTAHNGKPDVSAYIVKMEALTDCLIKQYSKCMGVEMDIITRIESMDKQEEKAVLLYRYVDMLSWRQIADKMTYGLRHVYRIHGSALQHFPHDDD